MTIRQLRVQSPLIITQALPVHPLPRQIIFSPLVLLLQTPLLSLSCVLNPYRSTIALFPSHTGFINHNRNLC